MCEVPEKRILDHLICKLPHTGFFARARSGSIEPLDPMLCHELLEGESRVPVAGAVRRDVKAWLFVLPGKCEGAERAAGHLLGEGENNRPVRVPDIPLGSLEVIRRWSLDQPILSADGTILRFPAFRTPSAMRESVPDRHIHRCTVGSGLAPGNEFFDSGPPGQFGGCRAGVLANIFEVHPTLYSAPQQLESVIFKNLSNDPVFHLQSQNPDCRGALSCFPLAVLVRDLETDSGLTGPLENVCLALGSPRASGVSLAASGSRAG